MSNVAKLQREKLVCTKLIFQEKYKTRKGSHVKKNPKIPEQTMEIVYLL